MPVLRTPSTRPAYRPTPVPAPGTLRGVTPSTAALRHRAVELWAQHWHGAHAPAWASRDAFIAASGADPTLSVDQWLAVTEPRAAWIAVELALPAGRVRYIAHRSWDAWWPLWRAEAPRLGSYPIAALASWLDASVRKGNAVDPRPHLVSPHPPDPGPQQPTGRWSSARPRHPVTYVSHPPRTDAGSMPCWHPVAVIGILVVLGGAALAWAGHAHRGSSYEHLAPPAIFLTLALLGTAFGLLHSCAAMETGGDQTLRIRRIWPLFLALLTWIPFIRALA